ncbi:MAG: redoxin domain-containing protein [Proteobacteria bacterium]|nr:redoxin domain-containing protein [Pseudomonadota bacterium]
MKIHKTWKYIALCLLLGLFFGYNAQLAKGTEPVSDPENSHLNSNSFPEFQLPAPVSEAEKKYLGLSDDTDFNIGQIKTKVLIIELFSFYCPHCQRSASKVNELYHIIEKQDGLKGRIKIIGIGAGNSNYEIGSFKKKYEVPFPLFPDQGVEIFNLLRAKATPTFIGIKLNGNGSVEQFYLSEGGFKDSQQFLNEIIKLSGIESGEKHEQTNK